MTNESQNNVILITGASSGIGAATARAAAKAGYRVALAARSADKLKALQDELGGPERALALQCDVQDFDQQKAMVAQVTEAFGRLDPRAASARPTTKPGGT